VTALAERSDPYMPPPVAMKPWCGEGPPAADPLGASKYYRARYYDPKIGRFISEDPIGFEGGVNFFAYVHNNPANRTDPMGLDDGNDFRNFWGGGPPPGGWLPSKPPAPPKPPRPSGCGSGWSERLVPDAFITDFLPPCQTHDACYEKCGSSKPNCDFDFYEDLSQQCSGAPWGLRSICGLAARGYLAGVWWGGGGAFTDAQNKSCGC